MRICAGMGPTVPRSSSGLSRHGGDAAMSRSDEIGEGAARSVFGQWLPEPVVDEALDAETAGDLAHDLSVALMLVLERLSPLERASFLLHDVFGLDFAEVGRALDRGERPAGSSPRGGARISKRAARKSPLRKRRGAAWPRRLPPPFKPAMPEL